ncbi:unnamed protein product, partial [Scytosiphon promiscuus]
MCRYKAGAGVPCWQAEASDRLTGLPSCETIGGSCQRVVKPYAPPCRFTCDYDHFSAAAHAQKVSARRNKRKIPRTPPRSSHARAVSPFPQPLPSLPQPRSTAP